MGKRGNRGESRVKVRIYVEGGGNSRSLRRECKSAFAELYRNSKKTTLQPQFIACGGRDSAFDDFQTAIRIHHNDLVLLLVDSEGPVSDIKEPWEHLANRDNWQQPNDVEDKHAYLMVQCMENWFLCDREALNKYFGQGYNQNALPNNTNIEAIAKQDVFRALENASRQTKKRYDKGAHSFKILKSLDPQKVINGSPSAKRLFYFLATKLA